MCVAKIWTKACYHATNNTQVDISVQRCILKSLLHSSHLSFSRLFAWLRFLERRDNPFTFASAARKRQQRRQHNFNHSFSQFLIVHSEMQDIYFQAYACNAATH